MAGSVYEKNIEAMRSRYSNIIEYFDLPDSEKNSAPEEEGMTAGIEEVCGKKVLFAKKGDKTFQLDSLYDDGPLLDLWMESLGDEWDFEAQLLMYGLGSGRFAEKFLRSTRKDCSIVIHEPSEKLFKTAIENFDLTGLFSDTRVRIVFWPLCDKGEEVGLFYSREIFEYKDIAAQKTAFYPNYPRLFESDAQEFINGIELAREQAVANRIVYDRFGGDYSRNSFNNIKFIPESLSYRDLIDAMPEDIPAIIVAAGPSLDKNIKDLADAVGKCIIIATDTALKPLALAGIQPDFSAIMDGKKDKRYMSEEASRVVPLLCTPRSGDTFLNLHTGPKFFTDYYCDHIKNFMDESGCRFLHIPTGGSVANSCFGIAEDLHCKRIILVGQDLAYTGDKTHSSVTVRGSVPTAVEDLEHVVMGVDINGDPIRTSREFNAYREWFEHEIKVHPELTVIDATEGGVRIEGTELMTLKEAVKRECTVPFDFKEVLKKVGKLLPDDKREDFKEYFEKVPQQLGDLKMMIEESIRDYRSMRELVKKDRYQTPEFSRLYKESRKLGDRIEESMVVEYVHNQLQDRVSKMLDSVYKLEKDEKSDLLSVCDIGEKYLTDMLDALHEIQPYVDGMRSDIEKMFS